MITVLYCKTSTLIKLGRSSCLPHEWNDTLTSIPITSMHDPFKIMSIGFKSCMHDLVSLLLITDIFQFRQNTRQGLRSNSSDFVHTAVLLTGCKGFGDVWIPIMK